MNEWWLLSLLACFTFIASFLIVFPLRRHVLTSIFLLPTIFLIAFSGYYYWGGFAKWSEYVHYQEKKKQAQVMLQSIKGPEELIEKLRAKLDASPKSAKGWYLLGRLYAGQNEQQHAADAFATAHRLNPKEEQYTVHYAHSLWELNHQQFTDQIRELFRNLLKNNPDQPDALAMLAMDAFLSHNDEVAISYWQRLLKLASPQSDEAQAIRKAIAKAQARSLKNKTRESLP
jgi:cytochrome c-type biogenesis protein CcmH/NrfG